MNTFNLGFDMALLTVVAATLSGGDPVTWTLSIGGPDPRVEAPLGGLLGLLGALFFFSSLSRALSLSCVSENEKKKKEKEIADPIAKIQANPKVSNIPTTSSKSTPP